MRILCSFVSKTVERSNNIRIEVWQRSATQRGESFAFNKAVLMTRPLLNLDLNDSSRFNNLIRVGESGIFSCFNILEKSGMSEIEQCWLDFWGQG